MNDSGEFIAIIKNMAKKGEIDNFRQAYAFTLGYFKQDGCVPVGILKTLRDLFKE